MRHFRASSQDDTGAALVTVVILSAVLFMLVAALLVLEQYYTSMVRLRTTRVDATHVADAGLNNYLYQIKAKSSYYLEVPDTGWVSYESGRYRVVAVPPGNGNPLTLYSTGSANNTVTIAATVRYPTFADYTFLSNGDIWFGTGANIDGQVRSNGSVRNDGHISGKTFAVTSIYGSGTFGQGKFVPYAAADFGQIDVKMDDVMTAAKGHSPSSYFPDTPASGYKVTFNGTNYTVEKVTGGTTTGNLTTTMIGVYSIPADGAVYFDDKTWIQGNYAANVTICCSSDIYIMNSYRRTVSTSKYASGLISNNNIIVPSWYASVPQDIVINAAVLAKTGKFYADMKSGVFRNSLTLLGAATYADSTGGFVTINGSGQDVAGFHTRYYNYDQTLDSNPPPYYPPTGDGSLKVATWIENGGINR